MGYTGVEERTDSNTDNKISVKCNPNLFSHELKINYNLANDCNLKISVLNILGQKLNTLIDKNQSKGEYSATWDGTNNKGEKLPPGIYFLRISTDRENLQKK